MICKYCKEVIKEEYLHRLELLANEECLKCNHFMGLLRRADRDRCVVSLWHDGKTHHFFIGGENERFKGFGGEPFKIEYLDGRVVETTNLWHQGEIPEHLLKYFPIQARIYESRRK